MKYKLFRSPGDLDKAVRKHELVAVETGKSIDDVADVLFLWILLLFFVICLLFVFSVCIQNNFHKLKLL